MHMPASISTIHSFIHFASVGSGSRILNQCFVLSIPLADFIYIDTDEKGEAPWHFPPRQTGDTEIGIVSLGETRTARLPAAFSLGAREGNNAAFRMLALKIDGPIRYIAQSISTTAVGGRNEVIQCPPPLLRRQTSSPR